MRGDDIDTDRIMPARFLRSVTFDGLETHVFEDDRKSSQHTFDDPRYQGATVVVVNANFGCGSSREHAPQALQRWGIQAVMERIEQNPQAEIHLDLAAGTCEVDGFRCVVSIPPNARDAFISGAWDTTGMLLDHFEDVQATAARLPYVSDFASPSR